MNCTDEHENLARLRRRKREYGRERECPLYPSALQHEGLQCEVRLAAFCGTGHSQCSDVNYDKATCDDDNANDNHSLRLALPLHAVNKKGLE